MPTKLLRGLLAFLISVLLITLITNYCKGRCLSAATDRVLR